jgi:DNA-binding NarL/FixJ family response regulator
MINVVLADDHPIVRVGIRSLLEHSAAIAVIGEAASGKEAIQLVQRLQPAVLVLDMSLPDMDGIAVIQQLQADNLATKILALSAYDDNQYTLGILEYGAQGYLLKGDAPQKIVEAVEEVARGQSYFSQTLIPKLLLQKQAPPPTPPTTDKVDPLFLTQRETEVLQKLTQGWENQRIAEALCIEIRTVKFHTKNIYEKLQVKNRTEAILYALTHQLVA